MAEVFISYARTDQGFVRDLNAALKKVNRETWIDWRSIPDTAEWRAEIFAGIEQADNFVFIISPDSLKSWMCGEEVKHAVANNKRLITILYHPVERENLLPVLAGIQWIEYPNLGFEETFKRLIAALDTDRDWERQHTRFRERAAEWESKDRDQGFLLHGMELKEAVRWLEQATAIEGRKPTKLQEQFIRASEEWEAGEIQRLKGLNAEKERQARIASARERVAFSTISLDEDPERSILLAMHAVDATRSADQTVIPEAEDALHRALLRSQVRVTMFGHSNNVDAVAVTPDGKLAVSASWDQTLKVWKLGSGREQRTLSGHSWVVSAVAVTPDGQLVVSASWDKTLKVWDLGSGRELRTLSGHTQDVTVVAVTQEGRLAVSASYDKTLKVWELGGGRELRTLSGHSNEVTAVAVTPDGKLVVSASSSPVLTTDNTLKVMDCTLKVWDVGSGRELLTLRGHTGGVSAVAVTQEGRLAVSASYDKTLKVWDLASGRELRTLTGHTGIVGAVAVTPDGHLAVSASCDQTLKVWELASGRELRTLSGHTSYVYAVTVTPDGHLAVSAGDCELKMWELGSGRELRTLNGHTSYVLGVAVTPNGKRLASASEDQTVRIWDMESGRELITLVAHRDAVRSVAWSPDGKVLLSAGNDGIIQVYAMDIDLLMELARSRVTRNLTLEECQKYLHLDEVPPIR